MQKVSKNYGSFCQKITLFIKYSKKDNNTLIINPFIKFLLLFKACIFNRLHAGFGIIAKLCFDLPAFVYLFQIFSQLTSGLYLKKLNNFYINKIKIKEEVWNG